MKLSTNYLGLTLDNPIVVGASPFCDDVQVARRLEDAGAAAIVMRSLFEEQIDAEQRALIHHTEMSAGSAEATSYFPPYSDYQLTPDRYLHQLERLKKTLSIPVIASLNGSRPGGWIDYAGRLEEAGADALELNLYRLVTDPARPGDEVEAELVATVRDVTSTVDIPVAVKISPFHTSPAFFATELERAGAAGVVLFNRFYQPDIDAEELEVSPQLKLSDRSELLLRLRWLAIISPHMRGSLSASGGIHAAIDAVKAILAGAHTVQIVSALLTHGPGHLTTILEGVRTWLDEHDYTSVAQLRGAMNHQRCPDPSGFERANYIRILQSWRI